MVLLRFIYLTLPNFAGKLLKALSKEGKQKTNTTRPKIGREAHLLAPNSHPTRNGELSKKQHRQKQRFTRHGEWSYLGGEQGRLNSPLMTWHKPTREETSTRNGEQRNSRGELMQMRKLINNPWSFLKRELDFISKKHKRILREREIGLVLHRVRVIEVGFFLIWWEITKL